MVGLRSPEISASRSSSDSLIVQSAGASVVEIDCAVDHDDAVAAGVELDRPVEAGALDARAHLFGYVLNAHEIDPRPVAGDVRL